MELSVGSRGAVLGKPNCPLASVRVGRPGFCHGPLLRNLARRSVVVVKAAEYDPYAPSAPPLPPYPSVPSMQPIPLPPMSMESSSVRMTDAARKALQRATRAVQRYGWISFWVQLTLSVVSAVILLFSVAFTSQSGPRASLYLTLGGICAGFLSTFWNFGYTRTGLKMQQFLDAPPGQDVPKVKKQQVMDMITSGAFINLAGLGSTLLGVQALVGLLVAKTLSNASANPFLASGAGTYNPVLALDVFLVQAATNTLMGHFLSLCCSLWLLNIVSEGRGLRFQSQSQDRAEPGQVSQSTVRGNAGTYRVSNF